MRANYEYVDLSRYMPLANRLARGVVERCNVAGEAGEGTALLLQQELTHALAYRLMRRDAQGGMTPAADARGSAASGTTMLHHTLPGVRSGQRRFGLRA